MSLLKKPRLQFGRGNHTLVFFSEDPVTVGGNQLVDGIPDKGRNYFKGVKSRPWTGQLARDFQDRVALVIQLAVFYQKNTVEVRAFDLKFTKVSVRGRRLQRGKPEYAALIPVDDKLHGAITKITHPVKKDQRMITGRLYRTR